MPVNRNALVRYRTIDNCLRNKYKKYTLEDLMQACSDALYEYEGIDKGVSVRTIQMDIQQMRSDKLGYNAPIVVLEKKYYCYEDPDYSITNIPLTNQDLIRLTEVTEILKQFKGFNYFQELSGMVQRLENKIHAAKTNSESVIDLEKNDNVKGLEHIDVLYQAIVKKKCLLIGYQSFKARSANTFDFHAYYLKEYRNRWFVIGLQKLNATIMVLALDRIASIEESPRAYIPKRKDFVPADFFKDALGVSVSAGAKVENVLLFADAPTAPYILTKPIHHSQRLEETLPNGVIVSLKLQLNYELEREILGFGDRVRVLAPERLKRSIQDTFAKALEQYQHELSESGVGRAVKQLTHKGTAILHYVYSRKEVTAMRLKIDTYFKDKGDEDVYALRNVLQEIPALKTLALNSNLLYILRKINPDLFLTKAIFFDKSPVANWYVTWHQDIAINVTERIETSGYTGWTRKSDVHGVCPPEEILKDTVTVRIHLDDADADNGALMVLPGSHTRKLSDAEISVITQNSSPTVCKVESCGIHIMKPLLLHASSKAMSQKHRRVIHLQFNTMTLPNDLQWAEYMPFR